MFFQTSLYGIKDEKPIVFIPGLFGSMGNDIIPGTGDFNFGFAEYAYRPMIENLESLGYEENKSLFVAFYNWTQKNEYSAERYIIPLLRKVKDITGYNKVNLVCHSMGGIVARAYVQGNHYNYDVDKLIMLGTPNSGSVDAYYFWGGGDVPYDKTRENYFYRVLRAGFLWLFNALYGDDKGVDFLRGFFHSIQELLPTENYGDYLFHENGNRYKELIPVVNMKVKNNLVNRLNKEQYSLYRRNIKVYLIAGKGVDTNRYICVSRNREDMETWADGKPIYNLKNQMGDGIVTINSVTGIYGNTTYINGDHTEILKECGSILGTILGRSNSFKREMLKKGKENIVYSIIATNIENIILNVNGKEKLIESEISLGIKDIEVKLAGENNYWIIIKTEKPKVFKCIFNPIKGEESNIVAFIGGRNRSIEKIKELKVKGSTTIELL